MTRARAQDLGNASKSVIKGERLWEVIYGASVGEQQKFCWH